jgi:hypothetical protein
MSCTARLFLCARCRCQAVLCSHCDRGNRYCSASCAQAARRHAQRAAARRYRASRRGRLAQAARQQRYRRRRCKKVTHQGSPVLSVHQSSVHEPVVSAPSPRVLPMPPVVEVHCQRCGRLCSGLVRQDFLRRRPAHAVINRSAPALRL